MQQRDEETTERAKRELLESLCNFAETFLVHPDMSYAILNDKFKWRDQVALVLPTAKEYKQKLSDSTLEMLNYFAKDISVPQRIPELVGPNEVYQINLEQNIGPSYEEL